MINQTIDGTLIYLGSPYSSPDPQIMELRYTAALRTVVSMIHKRQFVYSPIVHNHHVARVKDLGRSWELWKDYDLTILDRCDELYVLTLPAWELSIGLNGEMRFAADKGIPVRYIKPC